MRKNSHSANVWETSLNTLAQTGTNNTRNLPAIIQGEGSELASDKVGKGRAKRKMITQAMVLSLIDIAIKKGDMERVRSFWNTYHCQNRIISYDGRLYGKYCKNRFCTLCCSIRKAEIINRYYPVIREWKEPYFVTLTIKACSAKSLSKMVDGLIRGFDLITNKYNKRNQRGKGLKLIGVKSIECCFNPAMQTYNPHIHLIVASKEIAETLITEWLAKWGKKFTIRPAQDYRPVHNLEQALVEIIKYGSKIFTEPDVNKKSKGTGNNKIYAAALYNIFDAMQGLRIFERFGFNLPKCPPKQYKGARVVTDYSEWVFVPQYFDWLNTENELTLSGYAPPVQLQNLLENGIDGEKE